jgi:hypothetical protein
MARTELEQDDQNRTTRKGKTKTDRTVKIWEPRKGSQNRTGLAS